VTRVPCDSFCCFPFRLHRTAYRTQPYAFASVGGPCHITRLSCAVVRAITSSMASVPSAAHVMTVVRASQVERQVRPEHRSIAGQGTEKLYGFIHRRRPFSCDLGRPAMARVVVPTCVAFNPVFKEGSKCDGVRLDAKYSRVYVYCQRARLLVVRHGSLHRRG
jgi:hypothetical protein